MATLGEAKVMIRADLKPLRAGLKKAKMMVGRSMKSLASGILGGITGVIRKTIGTITRTIKRVAQVTIASLIAIGVASTKLAMDAEESENLFEVSMGKMAGAARKWSDQLADSLGLNRFAIRNQIAMLNAMFSSMGFGAKSALEMSTALTELSFDMASFYNLKPEEAYLKLQAGITGEVESLKRLGLLINDTTVKQYALNKGVIKGTEALTEMQKVQIRYALLMEQTKQSQGDLARTMGSATNVMRSMNEMLKETGILIGNVLIPDVKKLAGVFRDWLVNNKDQIIKWAVTIRDSVRKAFGYIFFHLNAIKKVGFKRVFGRLLSDAINMLKKLVDIVKPYAMDIGRAVGAGIVQGVKAGLKAGIRGAFSKRGGVMETGATSVDILGAALGPVSSIMKGIMVAKTGSGSSTGGVQQQILQTLKEQNQLLRQGKPVGEF